ncbi:dienelactone hydrolase [Bradyrhizobium tropiciagri]|nr:dienelactone hydrolase [Bradyrhizobium tropiciagri]
MGVIIAAFVLLATPALAANAGFEEIRISNGAEAPLTIGVWYPTDASETEQRLDGFTQNVAPRAAVAGSGLPFVVFSHGGGGGYESHYDTALALAHAGFVVAAVSHAGDTHDDQSQVLKLWRRPAQLRRLVSYMLEQWPHHDQLDGRRIGAFGFSNGGFTVLVAAGGIPDLGKIGPYCQTNPDHDLCRALKQAGIDPHLGGEVPSDAWAADPRIKAAVVAAPAFGFAFVNGGLEKVRIPIQLWRAADDRHQPAPWYEEPVRAGLPNPPEYHVVTGAGHYDFLPPCGPRLAAVAPQICADPPGFDRAGFHQRFDADVTRFFRTNLN